LALEKQRTKVRRSNDIDIKYGAGGLLDVYFAGRYLQLAHNVPNDSSDRSTPATLNRLKEVPSLKTLNASLNTLEEGYKFLAALDHNLRLTVGRTSRIPSANQHALEVIAQRMGLASPSEIFEQLTLQRIAIREAFESVVIS
jgi:glutamine synthetase adenylyltransferase